METLGAVYPKGEKADFCTSLDFPVLHGTSRYFTVLHGTSPYFTVLLGTSQYFQILLYFVKTEIPTVSIYRIIR